jgi:hypothetical protein
MVHMLIAVIALSGVPIATGVPGPWMAPAARCEAMAGQLRIAPALLPLIAEMCQRAPTFRRQVVRLARQPGLEVAVAPGRFTAGGRTRARTAMTLVDGQLRTASVEVPGGEPRLLVELVAHEFEHIVEQLDGVDLAAWSGRSGVYRIGGFDRGSAFETERAQQVGRRVAGEFLAAGAEITAFRVR